MNCQELELILRDLVRDTARDSELWESALPHLESCPQCSARLANERALETGLRQLASEVLDINPTLQLETRLLDVFRQEQASRWAVRPCWWRAVGWRWALAGGSLALLAMALTWHRLPGRESGTGSSGSHQAKALPAPASNGPAGSGAMTGINEVRPKTLQPGTPERSRLKPSSRKQATTVQKIRNPIKKERTLKGLEEETAYFEPEVATQFIPFMGVDSIFSDEPQQLVRVKLPRSALETFGLPVNRERAREPVQADLLVGEDGLIRAIRFVH